LKDRYHADNFDLNGIRNLGNWIELLKIFMKKRREKWERRGRRE
jgi:hypothetical protein